MLKLITAATMILVATSVDAQQKEGKVVYERTTQMQMRIADGDQGERTLPRTLTNKMEVLFGNNQSLRRAVEEEAPEPTSFENGGVTIRTFGGGADDVVFNNLSTGTQVDQREFGGKTYIITDSVRKLDWKLTGEAKTILGLACQKAIAQRIGVRQMTMMNNGKMETRSTQDTSTIVAWFAPAVPVSVGPEFQGQLPGLLLEIDINNGRTVYKALELQPKVNLAQIKEPKSGKKVTSAEFAAERDKVMQDMQRNAPAGGGRRFTITN